MNKLYKLEDLVKDILINVPETRSDDFYLLVHVYYKLNPDIINISFSQVMLAHKDLHLPYYESVSRCRRKLQSQYEELRPSKEVQDARINKESDYINYAIC